jgi:hypothetical protein
MLYIGELEVKWNFMWWDSCVNERGEPTAKANDNFNFMESSEWWISALEAWTC